MIYVQRVIVLNVDVFLWRKLFAGNASTDVALNVELHCGTLDGTELNFDNVNTDD